MNAAPLDRANKGKWLQTLAFAIRDGAALTGPECQELYDLLAPTPSADLLDEIEEYLEGHMDADGVPGEGYTPNKAMQLYTALQMARRKWP